MSIDLHPIQANDGEQFSLAMTDATSHVKQPVILCMPALGVPARLYRPLLESLSSQGLAGALFELRGIATSSVRASRKRNFGYKTILAQDMPAAIKHIRQHYPDNPLYLLGHSIGAQFAAMYMSLNPGQINGLIGVATGTPYYKLWPFPQNVALLMASKLMWLITNSIGHYPGKKLGFAGREARQVINDWVRSVKSGQYQIKGYNGLLDNKIAELETNALMLTIDKDRLAPRHSIRFLGDKLANGNVTYQHLQAHDFEGDSLGHFNWMKEPDPVVKKVCQWLASER